MSDAAISTTFQVSGMTCSHCVKAVTEEISMLAGVATVAVDLDSGQVLVTSEHVLDAGEVAAAVDEAGYVLVP